MDSLYMEILEYNFFHYLHEKAHLKEYSRIQHLNIASQSIVFKILQDMYILKRSGIKINACFQHAKSHRTFKVNSKGYIKAPFPLRQLDMGMEWMLIRMYGCISQSRVLARLFRRKAHQEVKTTLLEGKMTRA